MRWRFICKNFLGSECAQNLLLCGSEGSRTVQREKLHVGAFSAKVCCNWDNHSELTSPKAQDLDPYILFCP